MAVAPVLTEAAARRHGRLRRPALAAAAAGETIVAVLALARAPAAYLPYALILLLIPWAGTLLQLHFSCARNARLDAALRASLAELADRAAELQASRARIVAAADHERRRIERNLHDGAQQRLTALAVSLGLAAQLAEQDARKVRQLLTGLCREVAETAHELRTLAHGIYPPLLRGSGLAAALTTAVRQATIPVTMEAGRLGRYPQEAEAAVYFCCLEAVHNACKHAGPGARLALRVEEIAGALVFDAADDGRGFDPGRPGPGAGFLSMADRLGALGGNLQVRSAPGRGTRVSGSLPLTAVTAAAGR